LGGLDRYNLWLIAVERGIPTRLTTGLGLYPAWSPDSQTILFTSGAPYYLFRKQASGVGTEQRLTGTPNQFLTDWSSDGRYLVGQEGTSGSHQTLWFRTATPDDAPSKPYMQTAFNAAWGRFSPDNAWLAFTSDESGQWEIYIDAFPESRGKVRISTHGGTFPAWSSSGRELFYVSPDSKLLSVSLKIAPHSIEPSAPIELFRLPAVDPGTNPYDVAPGGQRFLVSVPPEKNTAQSLTVIVNWRELLKAERAPR
jgi:hypothetical protein